MNQAARGLECVRKSKREGVRSKREGGGASVARGWVNAGRRPQRERNNEQAAWSKRAWGVQRAQMHHE